jgi:cobalt-zinc-cadmium efflux system outer membrane protein
MFANSIPRARLWAMLIAALCTPVAGASNVIAPPQDTELSLAEALRRAESRHPLFQSYRAQLAAAEARTRQARLRPAPELNLELEDALGSGALSGLDKAQMIERGGLRDRRLDARRAEREGLVTEAEIARLDLRAEVARRFIHVLSDQAQLGIAHQATRLARSTLAEVNRRVDAARAPLAERSRAQVSLARAELEEEHAEHELLSARRHLAAATGVMAPDFGALVGDLLQLPEVAAFDVLLAQMQTTPDVLLFANQARLRASELRLAQARRSTSVRVGAGLRRVEATDDVGLVLSAALPLFSRARAAGAIAENEARLAEVGPAREQAWLKAQAHLFALYQELSHARIEYEAQRDRVVPAMEEALKQTQHAYRRGRYSLLELRDAQAEWAVQKARLIEAATEYHGHLIEIQRLTGAPAPSGSPTESNAP